MTHIHWLGAGLSSVPGIRRIASSGNKITVWNRTLSKAEYSINHINSEKVLAKKYDLDEIKKQLNKGDIVVSQLSANMHPEIAKVCLEKNCHFASTSYISPNLKELDLEAKERNLVFINEIGLDPGIDHFFSHLLVSELKQQNINDCAVSYYSYCGGIPAVSNDFKYKFSWSPVGVIKALNNKAKFISNFQEKEVIPYHQVSTYSVNDEDFEAYPNRDSIPYITEYNFDQSWKINNFVRGTLRLNGWTKAWKEIFLMLENPSPDIEEKIQTKSDELWANNQYEKDERDRVVLSVKMEASNNDGVVWARSYELDQSGSGENSAMAILVSITLSAGIDLILNNQLNTGVQAAPSDKENIEYFFKILKDYKINYISK